MEKLNVFAGLVESELARARASHPPINSLHEGYAVILEELDEFKAEVWKKSAARDPRKISDELVQLAAMAQRLHEDVVTPMIRRMFDRAPIDASLLPGPGRDGVSGSALRAG